MDVFFSLSTRYGRYIWVIDLRNIVFIFWSVSLINFESSRRSYAVSSFPHPFPSMRSVTPTRPSKIILAIHGENWLEFYYHERAAREKKEGKSTLEGQHMARLAKPLSPTAFEVSGMKEAAVEFTWLLCLPLGPEDSLRGYPPLTPLLPSFSFRRNLTHETSYNPSFYPSGVARSCLSESRNDYRYGRRWPNIRVNPSVEREVLRE